MLSTAEIERAFLSACIRQGDRDVLRLLWLDYAWYKNSRAKEFPF